MAGKPGRSGPAPGNLNAVKNGTTLTRLTLGTLPMTMMRQTRAVRQYRRGLEQLVMQAKGGEVNATDAHLIDEATGAEMHAAVCRWLLREKLQVMTVGDISRCSEQIMKARALRNRAVERLGLDKPLALPWQVVDGDADAGDAEEKQA